MDRARLKHIAAFGRTCVPVVAPEFRGEFLHEVLSEERNVLFAVA